SGKAVHQLKAHRGPVNSVSFAPGREQLASAGQDGSVKIWDVDSGKQILAFESGAAVNSVVYSPDGKTLAWGDDNNQISLWEEGLQSGSAPEQGPRIFEDSERAAQNDRRVLPGHTGPVTSLAFSPDGKRLASVSRDATMKIWDPVSGREAL